MKTIKFLYILILALFLTSCSEMSQYSPTSPEKVSEPNWISLPALDDLANLNKLFTVSKLIKGSSGGSLNINENYLTTSNTKVHVSASLVFPKGCFGGEKLITMSIDDESALAEFSPCMDFIADKVATLSITFKGINLSSINVSKIKFVYQAPNGTIEPVVYDKMLIDPSTGKLQITNAKIPHFSRYGFIN